ncbi:MAG: hypothetical protein LBC89_00420 [Bacteroidales bacterium]|jgi:hypothetical protein|nr:hypothetical protein [Bacteroidales bacterium]
MKKSMFILAMLFPFIVYAQSNDTCLVVAQEWDDVLYFPDSLKEYVDFQWYKNGEAVNEYGAFRYYSDANGLDAYYYVRACKPNGECVETCPVYVMSSRKYFDELTLSPNPIAPNATLNIVVCVSGFDYDGAELQVFTNEGRIIGTTPVAGGNFSIPAPNKQGKYLLRLVNNAGDKYLCRLVVL